MFIHSHILPFAVSDRGKLPYQNYFVSDRAVTAVLLSSVERLRNMTDRGIEPTITRLKTLCPIL